MSHAALDPHGVAGLELNIGRASALDVGAQVEVGDGDHYVRPVVMMLGHDAAGVELYVGGADTVFNEEKVQSAAIQNVQPAFFIPFVRELRGIGLHDFDSDYLEWLVLKILCGVGEGAGDEHGFAFLKLAQEGGLSDDVVLDARRAEDDEDVIMPVVVQEHGGMGRQINLERPRVLVFEQQLMAGLSGDFDNRGSRLRGGRGQRRPIAEGKASDVSSGEILALSLADLD